MTHSQPSARARRRSFDNTLAIAYLRASKNEQKLSPQAQRAAIELWASREGITIASWHADHVSGATPLMERPGFVAALNALRAHKAARIVVAKRDRIARDMGLAYLAERATESAGARLVSADGASDRTGVEGLIARGIEDLFAAVEREKIRERTRAALRALRAQGKRTGGDVPFGFRVGDDARTLLPIEHEQATIARARELRAAGLSLRAVSAALASEGRLARTGRAFEAQQVARLVAA
jgi:DNA invertase Pin-like site-specific DNA recombinase